MRKTSNIGPIFLSKFCVSRLINEWKENKGADLFMPSWRGAFGKIARRQTPTWHKTLLEH